MSEGPAPHITQEHTQGERRGVVVTPRVTEQQFCWPAESELHKNSGKRPLDFTFFWVGGMPSEPQSTPPYVWHTRV